jgi:hypothetical protein
MAPAGMHLTFVMLYLIVSCYLLVQRRRDMMNEWNGIKVEKPNELAVPKTLAQSYIPAISQVER